MKRKFLILLCLVFIVSMAAVSASDDLNRTVDKDTLSVSLNNYETLESSDVGTFSDLQRIVDNSDVGSTIILEKDYAYDNNTDNSAISIDKALTINGNGHTILGDKSKGLFYIYKSDVVLNNISLIDGNSYYGGAIFSIGNLEVNNCDFINNNQYSADIINVDINIGGGGGAIYCLGSLNVNGCSFVNCSASSDGGAIYCSDSLTVNGCSFVNCSASSDGGAIFANNNGNVTNSIFMNCSSGFKGGAIYMIKQVINCSFVNCSAINDDCGAVWGSAVNCSFVNCSAINDDCGAVWGSAVNCSFVNCSARVYGGAIYGYGDNCSFVNCYSELAGGAIYDDDGHVINDCIFVSCYSDFYSGAVYCKRGKFSGTNCNFVNCFPGKFESLDHSRIILSFNHEITHIGDDILINVEVSVDKGTATGDVIVIIDAIEETLTLNNGMISLVKSDLASGNHEIYVKYLGDEKFLPSEVSSSFIVADKSFKDLQRVFDDLSDDAIVDLDYDYYYCDYLDNKESLVINKNIIINGNGHRIYGDNKVSIFNILTSSVSLKNISFINAYSSEYGGAVYSRNGKISVSGCSFVNCSAGYNGGAVYSYNGEINVDDCSFVNCSAGSGGGAISGSTLNISNSAFVGCSADSGGAISGSGIVSGCSFVNCNSDDDDAFSGGAISSWKNLEVNNCVFVNCSVIHGGGAIYSNGDLSVVGCSFTNCPDNYYGSAIYSNGGCNLINSSFIGGKWRSSSSVYTFNVSVDGEYYMDLFDSDNNEIILTKDYKLISSFDINANNLVIDGKGHAFTSSNDAFIVNGKNVTFKNINFNHTLVNSLNENTVIDNCSFVNCSPEDNVRGTIYFNRDGGIVSGCSFVNCSSNDGGGAIYGYNSKYDVIDCRFVNCSAGRGAIYFNGGSGTVSGCSFVNSHTESDGGAIYCSGTLCVSDCSFVNSSAKSDGGAIYCIGTLNVNGCSFVNCSSGAYGGAICFDGVSAVSGCSFVNSSAVKVGDAIYSYYANNKCSLEDSLFVNGDWYSYNPIKISNVYVDGNLYSDALNDIDEDNAKVYLNKDYTLRSRVIVSGNNVVIDGKGHTITSHGIVFLIQGVNVTVKNVNFNSAKIFSTKLNTVIENCTFVNCADYVSSNYQGGAILSKGSTCIVSGCSFVNCSSTEGGAIYFDEVNCVVNDCSFVNCSATSAGYYAQGGGAICFSTRNGIVKDSSFVGCYAYADGGAISGYNGLSVSNCSFADCHITANVDAITNGGSAISSNFGGSSVINCSFMDCSVSDDFSGGGAVFSVDVVSDCSFVNCSSNQGGGAVYSVDVVSDCSFEDCSARLYGGAIYIARESTVSGCSFVGCSAESGGAIYSDDNHFVVNDCSFVNCSAGSRGGAIYMSFRMLDVNCCSFVNCTSVWDGEAIMCGNHLNLCNSNFVDCSHSAKENMYQTGDANSRLSSIYLTSIFNIENCTFVNSYVSSYSNINDASISNLTSSIFINGHWNNKYPINVLNSMNISYVCYNASLILNNSPSNFTGGVTLIMDGKKYTSKFKDFSADFNIKNLNHGIYSAKLIFDDENVALPSVTFNLSYSNSFRDLNDLINNAKNGSVIDLTEDYVYYGAADVNSINITKSITINGNGHIINANQIGLLPIHQDFAPDEDNEWIINKNNVRIFSVSDCSVTLNNFVFMNAYSSIGGAIYSSGVLTLNDCSFVNCSATEAGAIYSSGVLTLNGCTFDDCYVIDIDGFTGCGGAIESKGNLFVDDSSFMNCISIWNDAGAIYSSGDSFTVCNSTFVNCSALGGFRSDGGAIFGDGSVLNCSFVNCSGYRGGAVYSADVVSDCSFVNCSGYRGGAVYSADVVSDCSFVNCSGYRGGAIYSADVVSGCSFEDCYSNLYGGGAIYCGGSVYNCSFVNCNVNAYNLVYDNQEKIELGDGGAIYSADVVSDCSFVNCSARLNGGAVYSVDVVSGCSFVNCSAEYSGGAIYDVKKDYRNFISESTFVDCYDAWGLNLNKKSSSDLDVALNSDIIDLGETLIVDINTTPKSEGNVKIIIDGKEYTNELVNSHAQLKISGLKEGNYDIGVIYYGDNIYHYNNATSHVKVGLDEPTFSIRASDIYQGNVLNIWISINDDASGTVNLSVKNATYSTDVANGKGKITVPDLTKGRYDIIAVYSGDGKYSKATSELTVNVKSTISASDVSGTYGNTIFSATFLDTYGNPLEDSEVKFKVNSKEYVATTDSEGVAFVNIDLDVGSYKITSINPANNEKTTNNLVISKSSLAIDITKSVNGDKVVLSANINSATATGNVTFKVNNKDYDARVENGMASLTISDLTPGSYSAMAKYSGDLNHNSADSESIDFKIEDIYLTISAPDVTKTYGGNEKLEIALTNQNSTPVGGVELKITLDGKDYTKTTDNNGKASLDLNLDSGNYTADIFFKGNDEYAPVSTASLITVNQLITETTLSYTKNSFNRVILTAVVSPYCGGDMIFTVNGENYTASFVDSKATYLLSGLDAGSYDAVAFYKGDVNRKSSLSNGVSFIVEEAKYDVNAPNLTKYYHGPERFVVTVRDKANNPVAGRNVTIYLNGATYTRTTNENGEASMAINLNSGVYKVTSEFEGIEVQSTITVKSTVSGENITKMFRNGTQYYAAFVDTSGKTLAENTAVEFNINGVFYTRYTNEKGVARMNINLNPGEYVITAKNPDSTEQYTNIITVLPTIVENYNLTKYYKNASQYSLRILDEKGNPVKAGVAVRLNINGVFYTRTSNDDGYVKMNINLEPGEYTITAEYNGLMASNKIKVLSVIETHDLVMKYKDGSKFEAKILDGQGKAYPGQKVTFNINGVFYERITGDDGIARLNINLMAGEYIITSSYNGMNAANKVTISS